MNARAEILSVGPRDHVVLFYSGDAELTLKVGSYLLDGLRQGGSAVVVADWGHRLSLARFMVQSGLDVGAARQSGRYAELDAGETLGRFVVAERADASTFWSEFTPVIRRAAARGQPVRVFGEMVALLWDAGMAGAAIDVEAMWNELSVQFPFSLVCSYPVGSVLGDARLDSLTEVCRAHTGIAGEPPASMRGWRF